MKGDNGMEFLAKIGGRTVHSIDARDLQLGWWVEGKDGVLSLSLNHGFPWADVPHAGAKMLAVADGDLGIAQRAAEQFGRRFYAIRAEATLPFVPLADAIAEAKRPGTKPILLADTSDQTGGGAPGDAGPPDGTRGLEETEDIGGGEIHGDVTGHRGDGLHLDAGRAPGEEEGEGVVDAGVGVDENGPRHLTPFPTPRYYWLTPLSRRIG